MAYVISRTPEGLIMVEYKGESVTAPTQGEAMDRMKQLIANKREAKRAHQESKR